MSHRLAIICTLLALAVPGALGQADFIDSTALYDAGLVKYWQLKLPFQAGQEAADAYLVDDQIYLTTHDGYVYAVHAHTGAIRWIKQITTAGYRIRRPCHANGITIFVIPSAVIQYDRYTGRPIRSVETRFPTGSAAVSDGIRFYVGGIDRTIYAFYLDQNFETWKARAGGQIVSQPALVGRMLYFASDDGSVYACVAENKSLFWRTSTTGSITADLAVDQRNVFAATRDNSLVSLSPDDGGRRWRTRFSGPLYEPPVVIPEIAFQYCPDDGLKAINTGTVDVKERVRWVLPRGRSLLTADEHLAYVLSRDQNIVVAGLDDGEIVRTIPVPGFTMPMPSPGDPAVYLASKDGRLFCARKRGSTPVQAADVTRAMQPPGGTEEQAAETVAGPVEETDLGEDPLKSKQPGPPIGGKSKVTKEYTGD